MRIADSSIMMSSGRRYQQIGARQTAKTGNVGTFAGLKGSLTGGSTGNLGMSQSYSFKNSSESTYSFYSNLGSRYVCNHGLKPEEQKATTEDSNISEEKNNIGNEADNSGKINTEDIIEDAEKTEKTPEISHFKSEGGNHGFRYTLLNMILRRIMSNSMFCAKYAGGFSVTGGVSLAGNMTAVNAGNGMQQITYSEAEYTSFQSSGIATTEDGRTIEFNVDIQMSRSFVQYTQVQMPSLANSLLDPLMINVGADVAQISDQKFRFDLDSDGEADEISMTGNGTGFLALDLNSDGKINDGSELFGTKSGDGFKDLAKYDSDGNGWIDENDSIFEKLKVWCKGAGGKDILMNLKEADVGAIFLGKASTDFSLSGRDMDLDGKIRATGIFLKESGGVGTVQHVDLAVS